MANTSWGDRECHMLYVLHVFFSLAFFQKRLYIKHIIYIHAYISLAHVSLRISLESQVDIFIFWNKKIQSYFPQHQVCTDTGNPTTLFIVKRFKILVSFLLVFLLDFICSSSELGCLSVFLLMSIQGTVLEPVPIYSSHNICLTRDKQLITKDKQW